MADIDKRGGTAKAASIDAIRLAGSLPALLLELGAVADDADALLQKLRIAARIRDVLQGLGAAIGKNDDAPGDGSVATLRSIAAGGMDQESIDSVLRQIQDAVKALEDAGLLNDNAQQAAGDALNHWGELEGAAHV